MTTTPSIVTIITGAKVKQRIIGVVSTIVFSGLTNQPTHATEATATSISATEWARQNIYETNEGIKDC